MANILKIMVVEFMVSIRQDISVWSKCKFEPMQGAAVWTACCWCACVRFLQKAQDILAKEVLNLRSFHPD